MKNIKNDISKNSFRKAYLLFGDEDYLKRYYKNQLQTAICGDDTMNFSYYEGKDIDVNDIVDTSQTLPFFAERRLILVENSGFFKTTSEKVADAVKEAPDTTCFVFVESEVDKRNKLYKTITECGYTSEINKQTERELTEWVNKMLYKSGKKIKVDDMMYLLGRTGTDMDNIRNEVNKLIDYTRGREVITTEDIDTICTTQIVDRVFDMINAIAEKKQDLVFKLYSDLIALKESPMKILAVMGKQFATLYAVRVMVDDGYGSKDIADKLGIRPYFINKNIAMSKGFSAKQLKAAIDDCVEADYSVKSGNMIDTYAVEMIIMKYSAGR